MSKLVRGILHHADFLEDHHPLPFHLFRLKDRLQEDIQQKLGDLRQVMTQDLGMKTGMFLGGEGVGKPSDSVQFLGNLLSAAIPGPLKDHMFDKVGNPVQPGDSSRDPLSTQIPTETETRWGSFSVMILSPLGKTVF